ncbi:MAG: lipoprotein-releasing ABC transporter permease subunit [Neomegalonema sp.]|nr:lipoprotein-releasing ABC transporter permease subunit [Neomegalonema sp.]
MTDRDPEDPRGKTRKASALDQLARVRRGLREGGERPGGERLSSSDAARRAREAFGPEDDGRIAPPKFGDRDLSGRMGARREVARLGDADQTDDASLVRSMLRDIGPETMSGAKDKAAATPRRSDSPDFDDRFGAPASPRTGDRGSYVADRFGDEHYDDAHSRRDDYEDEYDDGYDRYDADQSYEDEPGDGRFGVYDAPSQPAPPKTQDAGDWPVAAPRRAPLDDARFGAPPSPGEGRDAPRRRSVADVGAAERGPSDHYSDSRRSAPTTRAALTARDDDFDDAADTVRRRGDGPKRAAEGRRGGMTAEHAPPPSGRPPAPFGGVERLLAGRYLRARRKEGFISVIAALSLIGVTLAVAVLIIVMSVMNGFRGVVVNNVVGLEGHVIAFPEFRSFNDYSDIAKRVARIPGVTRATPIIEAPTYARGPAAKGDGAFVLGMRQEDFFKIPEVSTTPKSSIGRASDFGEGRGVAIGAKLAKRLGVAVGENVTLLMPRVKGATTPMGVLPRTRRYEVKYIFESGSLRFDNSYILMPMLELQKLLRAEDVAQMLQIRVATPDRLDPYIAEIKAETGDGFKIVKWQERSELREWVNALDIERTTMFFILSMLIVIASLVIISGLIMLVKEKSADIAILRTMGMTRGGVMRVFFMCGAFIGVVGTALGVGLGVLVALNINVVKDFIESTFNVVVWSASVYGLSDLPSELRLADVLFTVSIALGVSFLATLYPARRAAKLDPVEALRYE